MFWAIGLSYAECGTATCHRGDCVDRAEHTGICHITSGRFRSLIHYVTEQGATRIKILNLNTGDLNAEHFLDLPDINIGGQSGLQGLAFHPDYATNGRFYINLRDPNVSDAIQVVEYTVSADPDVADPGSSKPIISIPNPSGSHNSGWLGFSPNDGYLYIVIGDGGSSTDDDSGLPAQDLNDLHGKMLRIDVDGDDFVSDPERNYAIPPDNPFVGQAGGDEIFAFGLRHPFRNSFDRSTGDLYIADVGGNYREEIDFLSGSSLGGENFGWRPKEGTLDNPDYEDPIPPDAIDPIHEYPRAGGAAVIGGYVYRGSEIPELQGSYIYTDFVTRDFVTFRYDGENVTDLKDRSLELIPPGFTSFGRVVSFAEDARGELYIIDRNRNDILKIVARRLGDLDCDDDIDFDDILAFVLGIEDPEAYMNVYGVPATLKGDMDGDGDLDFDDIPGFVLAIGNQQQVVPEPSSMALVTLGSISWVLVYLRKVLGARPSVL